MQQKSYIPKAEKINTHNKRDLEEKHLQLMALERNFDTVSQICSMEKDKNLKLTDKLASVEKKYADLLEDMKTKSDKISTFEKDQTLFKSTMDDKIKFEKENINLKARLEKSLREINLKSLDIINYEKELNNLRLTIDDFEKELKIKER